MGVRTTVVATVVAAALCFPMAGVAAAQDLDCSDFPTQAAAQAESTTANPTDPYDLDRDNDNRACEWLPNDRYEDGSARRPPPRRKGWRPVPGAPPIWSPLPKTPRTTSSGPLLPLGIVGGAVLAAGGLVLVRRRSVGKRTDSTSPRECAQLGGPQVVGSG